MNWGWKQEVEISNEEYYTSSEEEEEVETTELFTKEELEEKKRRQLLASLRWNREFYVKTKNEYLKQFGNDENYRQVTGEYTWFQSAKILFNFIFFSGTY